MRRTAKSFRMADSSLMGLAELLECVSQLLHLRDGQLHDLAACHISRELTTYMAEALKLQAEV